MKRGSVTIVLVALLSGCAPPAPKMAEPDSVVPPPLPQATTLSNLARPDHRAEVENAALQGFRGRYPGCASAVVTKVLPPMAPDQPKLVFDAAGNLASGVVTEPFLVEGCGKISQENVLTAAADGQHKTIPGVPGTTKASPLLVRDTKPYLVMYTAAKGPKDCKDQRIMNTRFEKFEGPPNPKAKFQNEGGRPYLETWTVNVCGMELDIPVHYIPNDLGTVISVEIPPRPVAKL